MAFAPFAGAKLGKGGPNAPNYSYLTLTNDES